MFNASEPMQLAVQLVQKDPRVVQEPVLESKIYSALIKPKSLGELWCNEDGKTEDDENGEEKEFVKFLPTTDEGLSKRFVKLFCEFTRQDKQENRNELVHLLDEMLRFEYITPLEYQTINNILTQSLPGGSGIEDTDPKEDEEMEIVEDIKSLIRSTTDYVIKHDKNKLKELIGKFKELNSGSSILEKSVNDGESYETILNHVRALENTSSIPRSKLQKFKTLLNNIDRGSYRVYSILSRLDDIEK